MPIFENGSRRVRLGYCTNVHKGETLEEIEASLDRVAAQVRLRLSPVPERMGVGLYLPAALARTLANDEPRTLALRRFLEARGLFCVSLNAFPFGGFHKERVKHDVYRPRWDEPERLEFTLDAARVLALLLPDEEEMGTVSTVPLGWAGDYEGRLGDDRIIGAIDRLVAGVRALRRIVERKGKRIRILLEPEPGCRLERTTEAIRFLHILAERCAPPDVALLVRHIGINFDCCHQAVMGEDTGAALDSLRRAAVPVGKIHLSNAVAGEIEALAPFAEPRWLHQVVAEDEDDDSGPARADDLAEALQDPAWAGRRVRCHCHVPIHRSEVAPGGVSTTQHLLTAALDEALSWSEVPDLEVETYTWDALPPAARGASPGAPPASDDEALIASLAAELQWTMGRLARQGFDLAEPSQGQAQDRSLLS